MFSQLDTGDSFQDTEHFAWGSNVCLSLSFIMVVLWKQVCLLSLKEILALSNLLSKVVGVILLGWKKGRFFTALWKLSKVSYQIKVRPDKSLDCTHLFGVVYNSLVVETCVWVLIVLAKRCWINELLHPLWFSKGKGNNTHVDKAFLQVLEYICAALAFLWFSYFILISNKTGCLSKTLWYLLDCNLFPVSPWKTISIITFPKGYTSKPEVWGV